VYLLPLGDSAYVPYCEPADHEAHADAPPSGLIGRLMERFRRVLVAADQARLRHEDPQPPHGWLGRGKNWALRWIADRVAEQRLLWQLRHHAAAVLVHPEDLEAASGLRLLREELQRDGDRHLRWLVVNAVLLILSGALMIVPGPNLLAYYFAFRVVGHFFSRRGARQGLRHVDWTTDASAALRDLRTAVALDPGTRRSRVHAIASLLELPHLASFVERVALRGA
jgi:hypothetical protein